MQIFRELLDMSPHVLLVHRPDDGAVVFANAAYERFFGAPPADARAWRASIVPPTPEVLGRAADAPRGLGELRLRDAQGALRWMRHEARPLELRDAEQAGRCWVESLHELTAVDVTDRLQEQAQLRESEERLRRMSETMRDAFYLVSPDARRLYYINESFTHVTGISRERIYADPHTFFDALHPDDRARALTELARAQREGEIVGETRLELRIVRPDGEMRWLESWTWPVLDEAGRLRQIVGTMRDVTDRLAAEGALRERTEQLERSLREKTVLLAEVHHRVKNNLQAVTGLVHLMAAQARHRPLAETVADLEQRIQAMALVHETLYRSADLAAVDMRAYLERLGAALVAAIRPRDAHVALTVQADADTALDVESAVRCGLIANELVSNALEHAFAGRSAGRIELTLGRTGAGLLLRVSDDGIGLPPKLDFGSERTLGLRLVQGLAEQSGGFARRVPETASAIEVLCGMPP